MAGEATPWPWIRVAVLLILITVSAAYAYCRIEIVRSQYQAVQSGEQAEVANRRKATAQEVVRQGDLFLGWAMLFLGGIVALITTAKVHRIPFYAWAYLALGPACVFLAGSLLAGWVLRKRYAYFVLKENFSDISSLFELANVQSSLFFNSVFCAGAFGAFFLVLLVHGLATPFEMEKGH